MSRSSLELAAATAFGAVAFAVFMAFAAVVLHLDVIGADALEAHLGTRFTAWFFVTFALTWPVTSLHHVLNRLLDAPAAATFDWRWRLLFCCLLAVPVTWLLEALVSEYGASLP